MLKIKYLLIAYCIICIANNNLFSSEYLQEKDTLYRLSQHEVDELNKLYESTGGDNWKNNSGWPIGNVDRTKQDKEPYGLSFLYSNDIVFEDEEQIIFSMLVEILNLTGENYKGNNLTGTFPNLDLQNLTAIALANNGLTGEIPNFNLPNLKQLLMSNNKFEGEIPNFNLPKLSSLELGRNILTGDIQNANLPNLRYLGVGNNQLTGEIPNFTSQGLKLLNLHNNKFTGEIPNFDLPILEKLFIQANKLTFGDLEANIGKYKIYAYYNQDTILPIEEVGNKLKINVDGSANKYAWFLDDLKIELSDENSFLPPADGIYRCEVTNSLLPDLTLSSGTISVTIVGISTEDSDRYFDYLYTLPPYPQPATSPEVKVPIYWRLGNPVSSSDIKIYNTMGVEISHIVAQDNKITIQESSSINGELIWDISAMNSGLYFLEIRHGKSTKYVKILLE